MSSNATIGLQTRAGKRKRARCDATVANAGQAIPGLPNHLVVAYIFSSEYFDDPADLARLPAVSRAMRDAVAATGLAFEELHEYDAVLDGWLSAVQRRQRGGRLSHQEYLCHAAARSGQLEKLKLLRANGCPWNEEELCIAAGCGHEAVVRALILAGMDINRAACYGATPLYAAVQSGHELIVRVLIEASADVNKARDNGVTPLSVSTTPKANVAQGKHAAIVLQILKDAGAV